MVRLIFSLLLCLALLHFPGYSFAAPRDSISIQVQNLRYPVDEFKSQRQQMVKQQIQARGIKNKAVLEAMSKIPRHRFVDQSLADLAYSDFPLPIGYDQTISQPYIVAYMTETAQISPKDKVLEIGTGCGYQAAVLGELAQDVYTIEIIPELAERARQTLRKLGYQNVYVKTGDGYQGWAEHAPYDAIIVTAAPDHIPEPLLNQLALNGRIVIPVGTQYQEMVVITKTQDGILQEKSFPVRFVPMTREPVKGE